MISSTQAHGGPFAGLFNLIISSHPVSFLAGRHVRSAEPSAEELTADLAPHLRVDIGLLDPHDGRGGRRADVAAADPAGLSHAPSRRLGRAGLSEPDLHLAPADLTRPGRADGRDQCRALT